MSSASSVPSPLVITPETTYVCVCTFQRNDQLRELLGSLRAQRLHPWQTLRAAPAALPSEVKTQPLATRDTADDTAGGTADVTVPQLIVVDNAPEPTAAEVVSGVYPEARYVHEPRPGIAAARNAALRAVPDHARAVVFLDDDERADPDWLRALIGCANLSGADTVSGPVRSVFPPGAPAELAASGYIRRTDFPTGPWSYRPATNNVLVRAEWFEGPGRFRFDETFNFTGGEDSDLFERMQAAGAHSWWCAEALVSEDVPLERTTPAWMRQRGVRAGHVRALKLAKRGAGAWRVAAEAAARAAAGAVRIGGRKIRRRPVRYRDSAHFTTAVGMWQSLRGRAEEEYRR